MHEARFGADELGEMGQKGDDVVLGHALDLVDARDVELRLAALFPDRLRRLLRDDADFGQRVAGVRLDLEPDAEPRLGRPDGDHLGAGIARGSWVDRLGCVEQRGHRNGRQVSAGAALFRGRLQIAGGQLSIAGPRISGRRRARRRDGRRLGGARTQGARAKGRAGRPPRRGGSRRARQPGIVQTEAIVPLQCFRAPPARSQARRSTAIRAPISATARCRPMRRRSGNISSPPRDQKAEPRAAMEARVVRPSGRTPEARSGRRRPRAAARGGWIKVFRTERGRLGWLLADFEELKPLRRLAAQVLDPVGLNWWCRAASVADRGRGAASISPRRRRRPDPGGLVVNSTPTCSWRAAVASPLATRCSLEAFGLGMGDHHR